MHFPRFTRDWDPQIPEKKFEETSLPRNIPESEKNTPKSCHVSLCQYLNGKELDKIIVESLGQISNPNIKGTHLCLEPQTTIYKWLFQLDDSQSLHRKWLFHQTSIYKWLFGVPGAYEVSQIPHKNPASRSDDVDVAKSSKIGSPQKDTHQISAWEMGVPGGLDAGSLHGGKLALNDLTMEGVKNDGKTAWYQSSNPLSEASNYLFQRQKIDHLPASTPASLDSKEAAIAPECPMVYRWIIELKTNRVS